MAPERRLSRELLSRGTSLFLEALDGLTDEQLEGPTGLPGWTGKHVVAHVVANAGALRNLVRWARTGEETPMYSSPTQREADIETGARRSVADLRHQAAASAELLAADLAALTPDQWQHEVRTAQGRTVAATEVPWMRTREVMIHAVDLGGTVTYADLPAEFLEAVLDDATTKRSAQAEGPALVLAATDVGSQWRVEGHPDAGDAVTVHGPLSELAAYVTGRPAAALTSDSTPDGTAVPQLPRWL